MNIIKQFHNFVRDMNKRKILPILLLMITSRALCDNMGEGQAMFFKADYDGAIASFTKAIEQDQGNYLAYTFRGLTEQKKRKFGHRFSRLQQGCRN